MDSKEVLGSLLMSGVRMLRFLKDWWKFIQIHQYYTMALSYFMALTERRLYVKVWPGPKFEFVELHSLTVYLLASSTQKVYHWVHKYEQNSEFVI